METSFPLGSKSLLRPGVPLTIMWGAALFFLAALKKMSKAGKIPLFSRNPSLGPKRSLRQSPFLLRSLDFFSPICKLESCSLAASLLCPCLQIEVFLTKESRLAALWPLYPWGPAWGRHFDRGQCDWRVWRCGNTKESPSQRQDSNPYPRLLIYLALPSFWSGFFFLCPSLLCLPSLPVHLLCISPGQGALTVTTVL